MEYTLTLRFRNAQEMQEAVTLLSRKNERGGDADKGQDKGAGKEGDKAAYEPKSDRTRRAYEALLKCERVQLSKPAILESWSSAFPHVDLAGEIAKAEAWAQSKDVRRSPKGWAKALNSWLGKAQDKARGSGNIQTIVGIHASPAVIVDPAVDAWAKAAQE